MKSPLVFSFLFSALLMTGFADAGQLLYLASTKGKTLTAFAVNGDTGALTKKFSIDLPGNGGPMAFSPDASFVYAAMTGLEGNKAGVATLQRADDGSLKMLSTAPLITRAPYIRTDKQGKHLLAAHYSTGEVSVYRIKDGICGELTDRKKTERTAHCIEIDSSGRFVFVPHTSPNKVYQFRLNEKTGKLSANDPAFATGPDEDHQYHQPRHIKFHPKLNIAYTSNERGGGISAWKLNADQGTLSLMQTLPALPPDYEGNGAAADINLTPDGRFAYVSNRDNTKRPAGEMMRDTLAGFSLDPKTGKMKLIGHFPTTQFPRSFCIDQTGKFVYAAGQRSAKLASYKIDAKTGSLKPLKTYGTDDGPIWVMCGSVK